MVLVGYAVLCAEQITAIGVRRIRTVATAYDDVYDSVRYGPARITPVVAQLPTGETAVGILLFPIEFLVPERQSSVF